jgi:haloalkane dehalogenase
MGQEVDRAHAPRMNTALAVTASSLPIRDELPPWLDRTIYPYLPRAFATDIGTMRYLDEGRGRPVVIVHGTPSWSFEWRKVISELATTHRVIVPDHLGFGLSDKPRGPAALRPEDHAERLARLLRTLDVNDAILVGHDFGGPIGLGAALRETGRFTAFVMSNTWMWSLADRADVRRLSAIVGSPLGKLLYLGLNASPRWMVPLAFGDRHALTRDVHLHYMAPFPRWRTRIGPWKLGVELSASSTFYAQLWDARAKVAHRPMRLVWGERDPTFGARELERWMAAFPHAVVMRVEGAGHFVAEEAPGAVVEAVRATTAAE